jgi:Tfp pilus assembly protein PilP
MKKYILACFLFLVVILSGCGDPVQDDLLDYVNEKMPSLGKEEMKIVGKYEDVTGPNYSDDQTLYDALKVYIQFRLKSGEYGILYQLRFYSAFYMYNTFSHIFL